MGEVITVLKKIFSLYCLLLAIYGTIGNIISILICMRKRLRNITPFKLFAFIAASDAVGLYQWNLHQFFVNYAQDFDFVYLWYCRYNNYMQNIICEFSAWLLVKKILKMLIKIKKGSILFNFR